MLSSLDLIWRIHRARVPGDEIELDRRLDQVEAVTEALEEPPPPPTQAEHGAHYGIRLSLWPIGRLTRRSSRPTLSEKPEEAV